MREFRRASVKDERVRKSARNNGRFTARWKSINSFEQAKGLKRGVTLFVDNITRNVSKEWLEDIFKFKSCKGLLGVYISSKTRKHTSKLFGFARFNDKEAARKAMQRIDGLEVGGSKLRISFAKYDSSTKNGAKSGVRYPDRRWHSHKETQNDENIIPHNKNGAVDGRKYAEVVKDGGEINGETKVYNKKRVDLQDKNQASIEVHLNEENLEWLKRSAVGFTKSPANLKWITNKLIENQVEYEKLTLWGQHKFILTMESEESLKKTLESANEHWGNWIRVVRNWKEEDTSFSGEDQWLSCAGVPLHCWCDRTFISIGSRWERVLEVLKDDNFEMAWIKIQRDTGMNEETATLVCEGKSFPIFLRPESPPAKAAQDKKKTEKESESREKGKTFDLCIGLARKIGGSWTNTKRKGRILDCRQFKLEPWSRPSPMESLTVVSEAVR